MQTRNIKTLVGKTKMIITNSNNMSVDYNHYRHLFYYPYKKLPSLMMAFKRKWFTHLWITPSPERGCQLHIDLQLWQFLGIYNTSYYLCLLDSLLKMPAFFTFSCELYLQEKDLNYGYFFSLHHSLSSMSDQLYRHYYDHKWYF